MWGLSRVRRDLVVGIPVFLPVLWITEVDLGHGDQKKAMRHACCLEMKREPRGKGVVGSPALNSGFLLWGYMPLQGAVWGAALY